MRDDPTYGLDEYRTVNADLAAALITVGVRMRRMDTSDGVTIEFVFEPVLTMDNGVASESVFSIVESWSRNNLRVDASTLSKNIKRIYKQVRDKKREWQNLREERNA